MIPDRDTGTRRRRPGSRLWKVTVVLAAASLGVFHAPSAFAAAFTITGVVANASGQGVANVDIDFINLCTGDSVFLVNDKTIASGAFSIVVNEGLYEIHFTPPAGSLLAAADIKDFTVAANASLGTIRLDAGRLVSGSVLNTAGSGIAGVDLKFVDVATGNRVWVSKDVTPASGAYAVRVRPGTYDVEYRPPLNAAFVTARRANLVVGAADITGLVNVLAAGFRADGTLKDFAGAVLKNVDLDFIDNCTGDKVPTANDNTDIQGKYAVFVPAGTYSVYFKPPVCRTLSTERIPGVLVDRNTGIGNTTLQQAFPVSGRVLDELGLPLPNAKLKFYDATTGARQGVSNDNSDVLGNFSALLPAGTFNVNVEPPVSRDLLVRRVGNLVVSGAVPVGDLGLLAGEPLSGLVIGPTGAPVLNVNINVLDSATRADVILAHDSSNLDGTFRVVVTSGTFDVQYDPPACTGLAPDDEKAVPITSPTALPAKLLVAGVHASGVVVDTATPIPNVVPAADLDFFPAGAALKSYTPGDSTDLTGAYDVLVKPGTYDVDYKPPAGSRLLPVRRPGVSALANVTLPNTALPGGWLISGSVHNQSTGLPVPGVRIDVHAPSTGAPAWTPHNTTDLGGAYLFAVDGGIWDLQYVPPAASGLAPLWRRGVAVGADLALGDTLLLPLTLPALASVTPGEGTTLGGNQLTIGGTGFHPDAEVRVGGIPATNVVVLSSTSLAASSPVHPAGPVPVEVINPVGLVAAMPSAFTYVEPANPVVLQVDRSGNDIVLTWQATGQGRYTVFRNEAPTGYSAVSILGAITTTTFIDAGGVTVGTVQFYNVD